MDKHRIKLLSRPALLGLFAVIAIPIVLLDITGVYASNLIATPASDPEITTRKIGAPEPLLANGTIPRAQIFMGELLKSANRDRGHLLWQAYPASIRGRVLSGIGGSDPLMSGDW